MNTTRILATVASLNERHRLGGLVPLPMLRRELGLPHAAFDALVLRLRRSHVVDIKIANDPRALPDADDGVWLDVAWRAEPTRECLYYAVAR